MIYFDPQAANPFGPGRRARDRMPRKQPLRLLVLAGGDSAEREVSLRSGAAVAKALAAAGHQVQTVDPADGPLGQRDWHCVDACFIALHGGAGEDGRIQQQLEDLGVPYTGSSPAASRLAMSKSASKERFLAAGVPTAPFAAIEPQTSIAEVARLVAPLGYPVVVKPDAEGSSIGVSVATCEADLPTCLSAARCHQGLCLAEPLLCGREFTVAVLGDLVLPLIEVVTPERIFSYGAKYQSTLTEYRFDFDLHQKARVEIVHAAVAATAALGTAGLVRVDVILTHDARAWVLEVNTIPGMTARSLAPLAAAKAGLEMPELCDLLVKECLASAGVL